MHMDNVSGPGNFNDGQLEWVKVLCTIAISVGGRGGGWGWE